MQLAFSSSAKNIVTSVADDEPDETHNRFKFSRFPLFHEGDKAVVFQKIDFFFVNCILFLYSHLFSQYSRGYNAALRASRRQASQGLFISFVLFQGP